MDNFSAEILLARLRELAFLNRGLKIVFEDERVEDEPIVMQYKGGIIAIGRQHKKEALLIPFPENLNDDLSDITNFNANSASFDFLKDEPDLYSISDLKKSYV